MQEIPDIAVFGKAYSNRYATGCPGVMKEIRCCGQIIGEIEGKYRLYCRKCQHYHEGDTEKGISLIYPK